MELLVTDAPLAAELRERITVASAGNPLFVEEMLAMVRDQEATARSLSLRRFRRSCRRASTRSTATCAW